MSVSIPLPPSSRDFLVYQRIVIDGASTRTVADELQISQTRIRQIASRVMQWLVETLPADTELSQAAKLTLGQHIAADRLERFYVEANRVWTQTADTKFASLCVRVIAAQSKIPALPGTLEALALDAIHGPLPADDLLSREQTCSRSAAVEAQAVLDSYHNPPLRDCSPAPSREPVTPDKLPSKPATTPPGTGSSDNIPLAARSARSAFLSPAHLPEPTGNESPVLEVKITPEKLGFTTAKPLSRKQRRRLRRLAK